MNNFLCNEVPEKHSYPLHRPSSDTKLQKCNNYKNKHRKTQNELKSFRNEYIHIAINQKFNSFCQRKKFSIKMQIYGLGLYWS